MGNFLLGNFERVALTGEPGPGNIVGKPEKWLGHMVVAPPFEAHTALDFVGPPGSVSGLYYSLFFQLGKWEYYVQKADEWIEVSPVHAQYYQLTHKQKEDLEGRIKTGLQSVSQAVADLELILHDKRKYEEFLRYMGYRTPKETPGEHNEKEKDEEKKHKHPDGEDALCLEADNDDKARKAREKRVDNHSLKAVFVDQVDVHTGDGISMRSIISRWPTLILDFMRLDDEDMDISKVASKLDISRAEAVVLITKNKLYQEWKRLFLGNIKDRYERISQLSRGRQKSVDAYRDWLKPVIARHKLIDEGLATPGGRSSYRTAFVSAGGHAVSTSHLDIWVWKDFTSPEFFKGGSEDIARLTQGKLENWRLSPYDKWTKNNLIFHKKHGLVADHKWITDAWVRQKLKEMYDRRWLTRHKLYYSFFIISLDKTNMRTSTGDEFEDGYFDVNMIVMSQNAMFAKLLELEAKKEEFEDYVNNLLGLPTPKKGQAFNPSQKDRLGPAKNFFDWFSLNFQFFKRGPYEHDFDERLTKYYFKPIAEERYSVIVGFLKSKAGMGK